MKNKLFALAMIALMVAMVFAVPMQINADTEKLPMIYVAPSEQEFESPCIVSTEFYVDIKIDMQDTGKELFAFDFNVTWDRYYHGAEIIRLSSIEVLPPWPEGKYYIVVNATGTDPKGLGRTYLPPYQLSITALDSSTPVTDKVAVVRLWFHIRSDVLFPCSWEGAIKITRSVLVSPSGKNITHNVYNGKVTIINEAKPEMWVSIPEGKIDPDTGEYYIVEWTEGSTFTAEISVANVTGMFGFEFKLYYNATILYTDAQMVHIKSLLPPPYEEVTVAFPELTDDEPWKELAWVYVKVKMPCEKPPISCVEGPIVNIEFETLCPTKYDTRYFYAPYGMGLYVLPQNASSVLNLDGAKIYCKDPPTATGTERIYEELSCGWMPWTTRKDLGPAPPAPVGAYVRNNDTTLEVYYDINAGYGYSRVTYTYLHSPSSTNLYALEVNEIPAGTFTLWVWEYALPAGPWVKTAAAGKFSATVGATYQWLSIPFGNFSLMLCETIDIAFRFDRPEIPLTWSYPVWPFNTIDPTTWDSYHLDWPMLNVYDGMYYFRPLFQDLNQDGHVDLIDLAAVAKTYGKPLARPSDDPLFWLYGTWTYQEEYTKLASPNNLAVDIFDIVAVAKKFCKPYTPIDPVTEEPYDP